MKHRSIAKVVSWILAALLLFTALPNSAFQVRAEGEEPTLTLSGTTTDEGNYANNYPLTVTATGGKWVGVYKKGENPSANYFFRFDVDGEPHNIYNMTKGTRTEASFPNAFNVTFFLFGDEGYSNVLKQVNAHINSVSTDNPSVLEVAEECVEGDPVQITARSEYRDASVAIYSGTYSASEGDTTTFADITPIERFYLCHVDNQGKTIEDLPVGSYTAVLYKFNGKSGAQAAANVVELVKNFEVVPQLATDKDEYEFGDPIMVTANCDASGAWVGLYKKGEVPGGDAKSIYWYSVAGSTNPVNLQTTDGTGGRLGEFGPGEYTVYLIGSGNYTPIVAQKDITIKESPYLSTDKDEYSLNDPIMVTVNDFSAENAWVGLYKYGETYDPDNGGSPSIFWYYLTDGNPKDILTGRDTNGRAGDYGYGVYTLVLFGSGGYSPIVAKKNITIVPPPSTLEIDKSNYEWDDPIMVSASSVHEGAWVGLYPYLNPDGSDVKLDEYLAYYYLTEENPFDITTLEDVGYGTTLNYGHYKVILFTSGYDIDRGADGNLLIRGFYIGAYDDESIVWDWKEDYSGATATFTSLGDPTVTEKVTAKVTKEETPATCEAAGSTKYTATVNVGFVTKTGEKTFVDTKTVDGDPALGHEWGEVEYVWNKGTVVTGYLWEKTTWDEVSAEDVIAITMTNSADEIYILTSVNGTSALPPATPAILKNDGEELVTEETEYSGWVKEAKDGRFALRAYGSEDKYLYNPVATASSGNNAKNNQLRVGTYGEGDNYLIDQVKEGANAGYLTLNTLEESTYGTRYLGVYTNTTKDWRSYLSVNNNIKDQTVQIWKLVGPIEEDKVTVTATRTCKNDETHVETETVEATSEKKSDPTCDVDGVLLWTSAEFENPAFEVQTMEEPIPALGHVWGKWVHDEESAPPTHSRICEKDATHIDTEKCSFVKTTNDEGVEVYKCTVCEYEQETNPYLSTDKKEYTRNEPIMVTANSGASGAWVGLYKKDEVPGTVNSIYWFSVEGATNPVNLQTTDGTGGRLGEFGYGDYTLFLFGSGGYEPIIHQLDISIVSKSSITIDKKQYKWGESILVTAHSPASLTNAWVGVYPYDTPGINDLEEKLIDWYYVNQDDTPETVDIMSLDKVKAALSVPGKYKVILFTAGYDIDYTENAEDVLTIQSFEILKTYDDEKIAWTWTDDGTFASAAFPAMDNEEDVQNVEAILSEEILKAATCKEKGEKKVTATVTVEFETKTGQKTFTDEKIVEIPVTGHAWGEWTHDEGSNPSTHSRTCANDATHKETEQCTFGTDNKCTVCGFKKVTGTLTTDKTSYEMGEPIMVYATCDGDNAWVGLYKKGEVPETNLSIYWYYLEGEENYTNILATNGENGRTGEFGPGEYTIMLFGSGEYEPIVATVDITVTGGSSGPVEDKLETDKTEYAVDDPIMVTAACSGYDAWVGLYKEGETQDPDQGGSYSIYWFWVNKKSDPQVSTYPVQLNQDAYDQNGRAGEFGPGKYVLILFGDGYYSDIRIRKEITILGDETPAAKIELKINDVEQTADYQENKFQVGTEMSITATTEKDGDPGNAWVGFYQGRLTKESNFKDASTEWYYVKDYDGTPFKLTKADFSVAGDYTVVLFGNGNYNQIRLLVYFSIKPEIAKEEVVEKPTCEKAGKKMIVYVDGTHEYETIPALGHDYGDWVFDEETHTHSKTCKRDTAHVVLEDCTFELVSDEAGLKTYKCKVCGGTYTEGVAGVTRVYGQNRYETSLKVAEEMKKSLGVEKFDNVILTTGENFADALGGGYLASVMKAPILLTKKNSSMKQAKAANDFITANLKDGGTIYVLGGTTAVPNECLEGLDTKKFKVVRLEGKSRYDTNLRILEAAGVKAGDDILVCTGTNFADSLAASSAGKAILLVGKKLTAKQKELLSSLKGSKMYILGGPKAVSEDVEKELKGYGTTERLSGSNRYTTMALIAKTFYPKATSAALVYSENFPDGLCAGPLANINGMPLLLVKEGKEKQAMDFCVSLGIKTGYILGGPKLIPDDSAVKIFSLKDANEIK